jgi:hypothetical protein
VGIVLIGALYFLPTIIGAARKVVNVGSVFAINLLLGWSLIGWAIALAMALRTNPPYAYPHYWQQQMPGQPATPITQTDSTKGLRPALLGTIIAVIGIVVVAGALAAASAIHRTTATSASTPLTDQPTTSNPTYATGSILSPESAPPVVDECSITVTTSADGNVSPLFCVDGGINTAAWTWYAGNHPQVMALPASATSSQVYAAMCDDIGGTGGVHNTLPIEQNSEQLAARYNGWTFGGDPEFTEFLGQNC